MSSGQLGMRRYSLFADYNAGTNRWYALGCCTASLVSLSFVLAWLRLKSDSLWPAALLHASHNVFVPCVFDNLIRNTGSTFWYTTQFGAGPRNHKCYVCDLLLDTPH